MWTVEDIELVPVELDFPSSGSGRQAATVIRAVVLLAGEGAALVPHATEEP